MRLISLLFSAHLTVLEHAITKGVCLSVCPSVTLVSHVSTVQHIETHLHHTIKQCSEFLEVKFLEFRASPRTSVLKRDDFPVERGKFDQLLLVKFSLAIL